MPRCQCANALITMRNTTAQQISKLTNQQIIKRSKNMLQSIYIQNYALIDTLDISFTPRFLCHHRRDRRR